MYGIRSYLAATGLIDRVARLVGALVYADLLSAILEHLRHERKSIQPAFFIQSGKDFLFGSDFNNLTCPKIQRKPILTGRRHYTRLQDSFNPILSMS